MRFEFLWSQKYRPETVNDLVLPEDIKETLRDVQQLLEQHGAGTKLDTVAQGKFKLSDGYEKAFLKYMDRANFMLRLYRIWLDNERMDKRKRAKATAVQLIRRHQPPHTKLI